MEKPRVFLTRRLADSVMARLSESCEISAWEGDGRCPPEVVRAALPSAEGLLGYYRWTAELMDLAPKLRIIANIAVGFDNVDVAAATARGIVVTNTPDVLTETTADTAFALMMAAARRLGEAERFLRGGMWTVDRGSELLLGKDVYGATLGIVGLGRIGAAMARRATSFNMRVIYQDSIQRADLEQKYGYERVDLPTLLEESDFVSLHVPLTDQTRGMIGEREIALMKPDAILVNASRGPVVNEAALIRALSEGRIAGAGLDVFEVEPILPDNPLLKMDNVFLAPHVGSATVATRHAMESLAADNVLAVLQGRRPLTPVNPNVLK